MKDSIRHGPDCDCGLVDSPVVDTELRRRAKREYHAQGNPPAEVLDAVRENYPRSDTDGET